VLLADLLAVFSTAAAGADVGMLGLVPPASAVVRVPELPSLLAAAAAAALAVLAVVLLVMNKSFTNLSPFASSPTGSLAFSSIAFERFSTWTVCFDLSLKRALLNTWDCASFSAAEQRGQQNCANACFCTVHDVSLHQKLPACVCSQLIDNTSSCFSS
jgi:hypothetical protein